MSSTVAVLGTGGTIASTAGEDGATPSKSGSELVAAVPELEAYADLDVTEIARLPSFDMAFDAVARVARAAQAAEADGKDGVVVTHGTDTMEESAYYLDLVLDLTIPVVLTGAQRRPDEVSADGPRNLLTAVRAATDDHLAGHGGVYVAFDEAVHAARDVTKRHASDVAAFESPDKCPVVRFTRRGARVLRSPGSRSASVDAVETTKDVAVVASGVGVGDRQLRRAVDAGVDGAVVEGTGLGNTTSALGNAVGDIADDVPVVVTTRCYGGAVCPVYGAPGGGETLRSHGAIDGGDLPAHKARLKLALVLESVGGGDTEVVRAAFEGTSP